MHVLHAHHNAHPALLLADVTHVLMAITWSTEVVLQQESVENVG